MRLCQCPQLTTPTDVFLLTPCFPEMSPALTPAAPSGRCQDRTVSDDGMSHWFLPTKAASGLASFNNRARRSSQNSKKYSPHNLNSIALRVVLAYGLISVLPRFQSQPSPTSRTARRFKGAQYPRSDRPKWLHDSPSPIFADPVTV